MTWANIGLARLESLRVTRPLASPAATASWLGAVQAQDYPSAAWAIGLRTAGASAASIRRALDERALVRTWAMRGTLHILAAEDVRWVLALVGPPVIARLQSYFKRFDMDAPTVARSLDVMCRALEGGRHLTRKQLAAALGEAGLRTDMLAFLLYRAALEQRICLGRPSGTHDTYVLLDVWLPPTPARSADEALAELALRYVRSHGPVTAHDMAWWSGLPVTQARAALALAAPQVAPAKLGTSTCWHAPQDWGEREQTSDAHMLPGFDEFVVGYADRSAVLDEAQVRTIIQTNGIFNPALVIDGKVVGVWRRVGRKTRLELDVQPFAPLAEAQRKAVLAEVERYAAFVGMPAQVRIGGEG